MTTLAYVALWTFVFAVPWEGFIRVDGISVASRATGVLAFGIALLAVATSGRFRRLHSFHIAALLFVVWSGARRCGTRPSPKRPGVRVRSRVRGPSRCSRRSRPGRTIS